MMKLSGRIRGKFPECPAGKRHPGMLPARVRVQVGHLHQQLTMKILKVARLWSEIQYIGSRPGHVQVSGFFLHPIRGEHLKKSTNDRKESRYRN
jgi:hypothetical protein